MTLTGDGRNSVDEIPRKSGKNATWNRNENDGRANKQELSATCNV